MVGGMRPSRIDRAQTIAARAPAAPMRCPVIDFGADTARSSAAAPNAVRIAAVSVLSLAFVDVPWATTRSTDSPVRQEEFRARVIAAAAERPDGSGATTWHP